MVRTPDSSALANVRSVTIGNALLRPVLDVNEKAGFESLLNVRVPDGPVVCVGLEASHTAILMALASAWHDDMDRATSEGWRGYRTFDDLGVTYAEITGSRKPITGETVRKYVSRITTSLRSAALRESVLQEMALKLDILRRPHFGYQIGCHGLEITGLHAPPSGVEGIG